MRRLELMVAAGCTLCPAAVEAARDAVRGRADVDLQVIDIDGDLELELRHRAAIPVVLLDGVEVARYAVTAGELAALLDA
ncbi:MAG: glutaredoxin family protein [Actinobacteria bacterium]|nr:glutaredoxin family protein [Actinomycetota bacterium]